MRAEIRTHQAVGLQEISQIPLDGGGRVKWARLRSEPTKLAAVAETLAKRIMWQGYPLTQRGFRDAGSTGLTLAIHQFYPGNLPALQEKLGLGESRHPRGYWEKPEAQDEMRKQVMEMHQQEGKVTWELLTEGGRNNLASAITRHYPGGLSKLKQDIGLDSRRSKNAWTTEAIEAEAVKFFQEAGGLTEGLLEEKGRTDLKSAISKRYPGRMRQLKANIGVEILKKPDGYWTEKTIEAEALEILQSGKLTQQRLNSLGRSDLMGAISTYYPGGLIGLKQKIGIKLEQKPKGYWTPENIREQAQEFYNANGGISNPLLVEQERHDLAVAVGKYPGGITQLRLDLKIEVQARPPGYWTAERIEAEAAQFYAVTGKISQYLLEQSERDDLGSAIIRNYPEGWQGLRKKMGWELGRRTHGYWKPEVVEAEALAFFQQHNVLSHTALRSERDDLRSAIRNYPGGMTALREKIGITTSEKQTTLSADEANTDLDNLLEGSS